MIKIIAIIYIFYLIWYLINSWKLLSEKPLPLPWKKNSLPPWRFKKCKFPPFCQHWKLFSPPPRLAERGGREERHEWPRWNHWSASCQHLLHFEKSITQRLRRPPKKNIRCLSKSNISIWMFFIVPNRATHHMRSILVVCPITKFWFSLNVKSIKNSVAVLLVDPNRMHKNI